VTVRDLSKAVRELKEAQQQQQHRLKPALRTVTFQEENVLFGEEQVPRTTTATDSAAAAATALSHVDSTASLTTTGDFHSCISEDEFFDLPEDHTTITTRAAAAAEVTPTTAAAVITCESDEIIELFRSVDDLMEEGGARERRNALRQLRLKEENVSFTKIKIRVLSLHFYYDVM